MDNKKTLREMTEEERKEWRAKGGPIITVEDYREDAAKIGMPVEEAIHAVTGIPENLIKAAIMTPDEVSVEMGMIFDNIVSVLKKFCDLKEEYYNLIALWIIGTYTHDEFETYPYLFFNAMRGSGKSRVLRLIASMSRKGELLGSMSEAALFRTAKGRTLCIDEFENVGSQDKQALRELLNAAYKKGQKIKRMKKQKEEYVVEEFEVYTSICMANIWGMEEVLGDRCITIIIEKSNKNVVTKLIENFDKDEQIKKIKKDLGALECSLCSVVTSKEMEKGWNNYILDKYTDNIHTLHTLHTQTTQTTLTTQLDFYNSIDNSGINGRNLELSFPLFQLAEMIGYFDETLEILTNIMSEKKLEEVAESRDVQLIDFVSRQEQDNNWISMTKVTNQFRDFIGVEDKEENYINPKWIGRGLKRLALTKEKVRKAGGMQVILDVQKAIKKLEMFK